MGGDFSALQQEAAVNNLIAQSAPAILCGPDCQKQKLDDELKKKIFRCTNKRTNRTRSTKCSAKKLYYCHGRHSCIH